MRKKRTIRLTEEQLKQVVKGSVVMVLESVSEEPLRIEDYFDLNAISEKDIRSIATDIRVYLGHDYGSDLTDEGELIIKEGASATMPIGQLRKELKGLGFKQWQIKSEIVANKVRIVILYADIALNTNIIINKMLSCGWTKARISSPMLYRGTQIRVMDFDPKEQKSLTKEARKYDYLYHWTPYHNLSSITTNGIEPRSENDFLSYLSKAHLLKGDIPKREASKIGWLLFNANKTLRDGHYALLRVTMANVPNDIEFYGDPRYQYGFFTKETIPPSAIELFGEITYKDKNNYRFENITVIASDDTMIP